jgi:putative thioredoxin
MNMTSGGDMPPGQGVRANGADAVVKNANAASFVADVIEASVKCPVVVDFWAPRSADSMKMGPVLEGLVRKKNGAVRLVKVNVDENKSLAVQLRVQSVPVVYAFKNGEPVDAFSGVKSEPEIAAFLDKLTHTGPSPIEQALEVAKTALDAGESEQALSIYQKILAEEAENIAAMAGVIRACLGQNDLAQARKFADGISSKLAGSNDISAAISALELAESSLDAPNVSDAEQRLKKDENDPQARFDLAMALFHADKAEEALDQLLEAVRRDLNWNDQAARKQILKIFDVLGQTHPTTLAVRRKLSTLLFS